MRSTLLLLVNDPDVLIDVAQAARNAGYVVIPGRHQELGVDALSRVEAQVALVHVGHEAADSMTFAAFAQNRGMRVVLFTRREGGVEERARVSIISARSPFIILDYENDASELIQMVDRKPCGC